MARQIISKSNTWKPSQRSSTGMTGSDFKKVVDELTGIRKKLSNQCTNGLTTRPVEIIREDFKKVVDELTGIRKKLSNQCTNGLTTRPVEIIREDPKKSQKINHNITPYLINGKKTRNNSEN